MKYILPAIWAILVFSSGAVPYLAHAQESARPILEVSSTIRPCPISGANDQCRIDFNYKTLGDLGLVEIETWTPFTSGPQNFAGVRLDELLSYLDVELTHSLTLIALNDYRVTIAANDATEHDVLLALLHSGEPMTIRDRGPIWLIYPTMEIETPKFNLHDYKMVWQLSHIEIN